MIETHVQNLASQMRIKLSKIVVTNGRALGCFDASLLTMSSDGKHVTEFVRQSELDGLAAGTADELLDIKIRGALERLRILLLP